MDTSNGLAVIELAVVRKSIEILRRSKIHELFPGYLCAKLESVKQNRTSSLKPNFKSFFDLYLKPGGESRERPYLRPFSRTGAENSDIWMNQNVAGSYAPSSIRGDSPLRHVIEVSSDRKYSLKNNHAELAFTHLAFKTKIPVVSLAVFMFRDFGFELEELSLHDVVNAFKHEFGYRNDFSIENTEFDLLYDDDIHNYEHFKMLFSKLESGD